MRARIAGRIVAEKTHTLDSGSKLGVDGGCRAQGDTIQSQSDIEC